MAYLDNTRTGFGTSYRLTVCLTAEECELLIPLVANVLKREIKRYEKYKDIHDIGEATVRQQNLLCKAENNVNSLEDILVKFEELIKANK